MVRSQHLYESVTSQKSRKNYTISKQFKIQFSGGVSNVQRKNIEDTNIIDSYNDTYYSNEIYAGTSVTNELQLQYDLKNISLIAGGGMYSETMTQSGVSDYSGYISTNSMDSLNQQQNTDYGYAQADINGTLINEKLKKLDFIIGGRFSQ